MLYVVDKREVCGGIATYADKFEQVLSHGEATYTRRYPSTLKTQDQEHIHFELGARSQDCIKELYRLSKTGSSNARLTATIHDCPYLTWGISEHLFPTLKQSRLLRKLADITIGRFIESKIFNSLATAFTLTQEGRNALIKRFGPNDTSVKAIRHVGKTQHPFSSLNKTNSSPLKLLFFGECRKDKGLEDFLQAASKLSDSNFSITIIGDGPTRIQAIENYLQLPSQPELTYLGKIGDDALTSAISSHDLAVFPYKREKTVGASGALITVMECGVTTMIPSDQTALLEYSTPGSSLVFEPGKLTQALLDAFQLGKNSLSRIGENGREFVKTECCPATIAKDFFTSMT